MKIIGILMSSVAFIGAVLGFILLFAYKHFNMAVLVNSDFEDWIPLLHKDFTLLAVGLIIEVLSICFFFIGLKFRKWRG